MLSATLAEGLERYQIGPKLRALRLRKKIGLVELGHHTGLSAAMLSKIERGRLFPTLPTLLRIALVFSVGLDYFFTAGTEPVRAVVRKADRKRFPERPGARQVAYHFESLDFPAENRPMNSYLVEFEDADERDRRPHEHAGVELIYVIEGRLGVAFDDREETLDAGDSLYFDATQPHSYHRIGKRRCSAVVVTA
ncbi:MAG: XRE family transcriptional regulator [Vicinamibacterales bacterium]